MSENNPSRRDLLTGKPLRDQGDTDESQQQAAGPEATRRERAALREESYVEHMSKSAMACQFEFVFNAGQYPDAPDAAMEAFELIDALEDQLTIYRDWSEVSRLNQTAGHAAVQVESGLYSLLEMARELNRQTAGAFDITACELSRLWGFSRRAGQVPEQSAIDATLQHTGMDQVSLVADARAVRFESPQVRIDLGGIGKGFAVDRCVELLNHHGLDHFLIHAGQSSIVARGERTGNRRRGRAGWVVGICHPVWPEQRLAEVELVDQALGTSGTSRQSFYHQGRRYGHVLDPRTGWPAEQVMQSTVIAPTAAEADALATGCYVLGLEGTRQLCDSRSDLTAILVASGQRRGEIDVHILGAARQQIRLVSHDETGR